MKTIWKFQLQPTDVQVLSLPKGAQLLHIAPQRDLPQLWALIDPEQPYEMVELVTFGTGHPIRDGMELDYVGSYQLFDGGFVGHVFRTKP